MNKFKPLKVLVQTTFVAVAAIVMIGGLASTICYADPASDAQSSKTNSAPASTNSVAVKAPAPEAAPPVFKPLLTGAELYSMHCNRCHPERYPTERTGRNGKPSCFTCRCAPTSPGIRPG